MWSREEFFDRATAIMWRYPVDNAWFEWGNDAHIVHAWKMYECVTHSALPFLLLGDTKIRADRELVLNFGLASAHGVQEERDRVMVRDLLRKRGQWVGPDPVVPVEGPGSILSDRTWTPLLNDTFVLAGIHAMYDFHLAECDFEPPGAPPSPPARFDDQNVHRRRWNEFFLHRPETLWRNGVPRVFARELIGLMQFGYAPVFTSIELGFCCRNQAAAESADFQRYLDALYAVNFQRGDQARVLGRIGEFLFGREDALLHALAAAR